MYSFSLISGYSIIIAGIIGLIRFREIPAAYQPFIYVTWLALVNEALSSVLIGFNYYNNVNGNIYVLAEALLFTWLFYRWGSLREKAWHLPALCGVLLLVWVYDNFIWHTINNPNSLFRICYSFVLVFLAINYLNKMIVSERGNMLLNARFLICVGTCIFYSYNAFLEVFYLLIPPKRNDPFQNKVFLILDFVNLFVTLIYALAALCIPPKQKFTQRY